MLTVYCLSGEMSSGGNVLHPTSGFNGQLGLIVRSGARLGKQAELQMTTTYQPLFTFRQAACRIMHAGDHSPQCVCSHLITRRSAVAERPRDLRVTECRVAQKNVPNFAMLCMSTAQQYNLKKEKQS